MKQLWQRHRTWFLAVLPGLAIAALLAWWFTPRPRLTVALPEIPSEVTDPGQFGLRSQTALDLRSSYRLHEEDVCVRASLKGQSWISLDLVRDAPKERGSTQWLSWTSRYVKEFVELPRFVNVETGEVVTHPGIPQTLAPNPNDSEEPIESLKDEIRIERLWFDKDGRYLVARRSLLSHKIRQIDWFDPSTKKSGAIPVCGQDGPDSDAIKFESPKEFGSLTQSPTQFVSPDGTVVVELTQPDNVHVMVRLFDLSTQVWREQQIALREPSSKFHISPSADKIAICRTDAWRWPFLRSEDKSDLANFADIYTTTSGKWLRSIQQPYQLNGLWYPELKPHYQAGLVRSVLDVDGPTRLVTRAQGPGLYVTYIPRTLAAEDESGIVWQTQSGAYGHQFAHDNSGIVGWSWGPGLLGQCFKPLASRLSVSLPFETPDSQKMTWINWQKDERVEFRTESPDEELSGTFAIRPDCVCLLVNPKGPNPRVEVWSTPPQQRPVLAIWLVSLAVTAATWFRLRRRARQAAPVENGAANG